MSQVDNQPNPSLEGLQERTMKALGQVFSAAQAGAVFGAPVTSGDYTVITASEVVAGGAIAFGSGSGEGARGPASSGTAAGSPQQGTAGGAGGGGGSSGRPVAVIILSPDGVQVKPVLDVTKLAIAGITTWGTMFFMLRRMRRRKRR